MAKPERWLPTAKELDTVEYLASIGLTDEQIATSLGIGISTFYRAGKLERSALRERLAAGRAKAYSEVAKTAYGMATSGASPSMTRFFLQCKMGWVATRKIELTGEGGGPIETSEETPEEKKKRLDAKLDRLKRMLQK
jgi:hypothetical protein